MSAARKKSARPAARPAAASAAIPAAATPPAPIDVPDYEKLAPARLTPMAWNYFSGGAQDEFTVGWNRDAYARLRLKPRVLVDVSQLDTGVTLFGQRLPHPILLAPTAYHRLAHPEGELATARGAAAAEATFVVSTSSTTSVEDIAAAAAGSLWFQLYAQRDREFSLAIIRRAEAAGCRVLVITVDSPVLGPRYREARDRFTLPAGVERANLRGLPTATGGHRATENSIYSPLLDPRLTWKDIAWLRGQTKLPVVLKGVMNPDDAARAADLGVAGVIVSNHGGRNLDTLPATIDALPEVVAKVGGKIPVLVDGGIRRGTDVLKAIALGASAVLIGRAYLCGLAVDGATGVTRVVNILRRELEAAMALTGRTSLKEIDASVIWK
ncbi:MAG: hypothetical protein RLZZ15_196 [Verrucomicrobiota bacterium]|jgi:4-hydroxymandelate oxidase